MNRLEFLKQIRLCADLSEGELRALAGDLARREFAQDQAIFQQGDPGEALYLIEAGQVRIFTHGSDGQETSVVFCGPGGIFGELAAIDGEPRSASVVAVEDTVVYCLSRDQMREHMRRSPQLALNFLQTLTRRVRDTTVQMGTLAWLSVPGRLARKLLELAQQHGRVAREGVLIDLALTQGDLGHMIGASRESVNKWVGDFRKRGWIRYKRSYFTIVDLDALKRKISG